VSPATESGKPDQWKALIVLRCRQRPTEPSHRMRPTCCPKLSRRRRQQGSGCSRRRPASEGTISAEYRSSHNPKAGGARGGLWWFAELRKRSLRHSASTTVGCLLFAPARVRYRPSAVGHGFRRGRPLHLRSGHCQNPACRDQIAGVGLRRDLQRLGVLWNLSKCSSLARDGAGE